MGDFMLWLEVSRDAVAILFQADFPNKGVYLASQPRNGSYGASFHFGAALLFLRRKGWTFSESVL